MVATYNYLMKLREKLRSCPVSEFAIFVCKHRAICGVFTHRNGCYGNQFGPKLD